MDLSCEAFDDMTSASLTIPFVSDDFDMGELDHSSWEGARAVRVSNYWSAETAPLSRRFEARILWSERYAYVRFEAAQHEPLIISMEPRTDVKTVGLWERDVCEIFIAPDKNVPQRYFEFEVAPTGEWLDLAIDLTSGERVTDWDHQSGMQAAARIEESRVLTAIRIPWSAFGRRPTAGDVWLGNILRCVGKGPDRGYLAWKPTMTETPNFHVPEVFGLLIFEN